VDFFFFDSWRSFGLPQVSLAAGGFGDFLLPVGDFAACLLRFCLFLSLISQKASMLLRFCSFCSSHSRRQRCFFFSYLCCGCPVCLPIIVDVRGRRNISSCIFFWIEIVPPVNFTGGLSVLRTFSSVYCLMAILAHSSTTAVFHRRTLRWHRYSGCGAGRRPFSGNVIASRPFRVLVRFSSKRVFCPSFS